MAHCSTASNRGYDELVPHHIDVVHETRFYASWGRQDQQQVNESTGMIALKKALNQLHISLAEQGFHQLMVDQLSTSVLLVTRHNARTHQSVLLIAHTSFFAATDKWEHINTLSIQGLIDEVLLEGSAGHGENKRIVEDFQRSTQVINGLEHIDMCRRMFF